MGGLPNCDRCGRFVSGPGTSHVMVPYSDVSMGDERDRCRACTDKYGPALCSPQYRRDLCCWTMPEAASAECSDAPVTLYPKEESR